MKGASWNCTRHYCGSGSSDLSMNMTMAERPNTPHNRENLRSTLLPRAEIFRSREPNYRTQQWQKPAITSAAASPAGDHGGGQSAWLRPLSPLLDSLLKTPIRDTGSRARKGMPGPRRHRAGRLKCYPGEHRSG